MTHGTGRQAVITQRLVHVPGSERLPKKGEAGRRSDEQPPRAEDRKRNRDSPWERHGQLDRVRVEREIFRGDEFCHGRESCKVGPVEVLPRSLGTFGYSRLSDGSVLVKGAPPVDSRIYDHHLSYQRTDEECPRPQRTHLQPRLWVILALHATACSRSDTRRTTDRRSRRSCGLERLFSCPQCLFPGRLFSSCLFIGLCSGHARSVALLSLSSARLRGTYLDLQLDRRPGLCFELLVYDDPTDRGWRSTRRSRTGGGDGASSPFLACTAAFSISFILRSSLILPAS